MINNIVSTLLGICLKMVDDHHDMNLYNKNYINFIKCLLLFLTIYWINIDFEYCTAMVIVCLVCYIFKQVDLIYYKCVMLLIISTFIYQFNTNANTLNKNKLYELLVTLILLFIAVYIEDRAFDGEYSRFKLEARFTGFIIMAIYLYINTYQNHIIQNIINLDNPISQIFKVIDPDVNAILIVFGYVFMSIIDIAYKLKDD